jgi:hypothetical protein
MGFNLHRILQAFRGQPEVTLTPTVAPSRAFRFYAGVDQYTGVAARSIGDFATAVTTIDVASLEFHVRRGDFENWFIHALDDRHLATAVARIRVRGLHGEALRQTLANAVTARG